MDTIVLASRNTGKIREIAAFLAQFGDLRPAGLDEFPHIGEIEETGATFAENALIKARTVAEATGHVALADDSGLMVDALNGAPGVGSARYSAEPGRPATDERNNAKLLRALEHVPEEKRAARFCCVIAAWAPGGEHILAKGEWEGRIAGEARGANGFGYDPLFIDPELGRHAAELSAECKNARSHRGKALKRLALQWPGFLQKLK